MISADTYDEIRSARLEDINGILELIRPLEEKGVLVRRSRERVESELECFVVNVRDNAIIACAALYPYKESRSGELSCFAVERSYREQGRGDRILAEIIARASALGVEDLFVLTTQTEHWFKERGFESVSAERLPGAKLYNHDRNAKVLVRSI
jgi:amino-acid N-acetyltransferase